MATSSPVTVAVAERIRRHGPRSFEDVVDLALYHPEHGFYATVGRAGRRGDFITSPEVGPLFGGVLARALDAWWDDLGRPDPFTVVEAGAGRGALAIAVQAARPACSGALTYVLVERSTRLRATQGEHLRLTPPALALPSASSEDGTPPPLGGTGPRFTSLAELPAGPFTGVVVANELLDNLAFTLLERRGGAWFEVRVGLGRGDALIEVPVPAGEVLTRAVDALPGLDRAPDGARIPLQAQAVAWVGGALERVERGRVLVVDYASTTAALAGLPVEAWLRTYRGHQRGGPPLHDLGRQDVTTDVCLDQLARVRPPDVLRPQADLLRAHGIDELVEEGRRVWTERGAIGDLEAVRGRSRVREAEALLEAGGLGDFVAAEWVVHGK
jgi:SAM-dependent MidA family methyltransferase